MTAALVGSLLQVQRVAQGSTERALAVLETENRRLREQIDEQAEQIRQLETMLCPPKICPKEWNLRPSEQRFVCALTYREWISTEAMHSIVRHDRFTEGHGLVSTVASGVRRKLSPFGFRVESIRHLGYRLPERQVIAGLLR